MNRRIRFKKIKNARELGGLPAADGRHIKHGLLIRSGHLGNAVPADIALLQKTFKLRNIVDFRIPAEISADPDRDVPGAIYENLSVLDEGIFGIARDRYSLEAWLNLFKDNPADSEKIFGEMYMRILFGERVIPFVQRFFEILLHDRDGAVLWHCSAGKDRAGVMTVLLLFALGVPENIILEDYLLTRKATGREIMRLRFLLPFRFKDKNIRNCVITLMDVKESYITDIFRRVHTEYGTPENFLKTRFGLDEQKLNALKEKYLE